MRALTQAEYEVLRGDFHGREFENEDAEGARFFEVSDALILRGCLRLVRMDDDVEVLAVTPLGRLALRVSRPEMAMGLP